VVAAGDDSLAVGGVEHAGNPSGVSLQGEEVLARPCIADLHALTDSHDELLAVGADGHSPELTEGIPLRILHGGEQLLACFGFPYLDCWRSFTERSAHPEVARRDDVLAVGADRHAADHGRVLLEGEDLPAVLDIPDPHRSVPPPGDKALTVGGHRQGM